MPSCPLTVSFLFLLLLPQFFAQDRVRIGELPRNDEYGISGTVYAIDTRTLEIEDFNNDGSGPALFFWVDRGDSATSAGLRSPFADTCLIPEALPSFRDETVRVELPDGLTLSDIGYFSIWCELARAEFSGLRIDADSLQGVPEAGEPRCSESATSMQDMFPVKEGYNCEPLSASYQVRWKVDADSDKVNIELVASLGEERYMGFGVSGAPGRTFMDQSDVVIAYKDGDEYFAVDYHVSGRSQCSSGVGVCPDTETAGGNGENHVTDVEGESKERIIRIEYSRPISAQDSDFDKPISTDGPTFIVWATGPINAGLPMIHRGEGGAIPREDVSIDFNRQVENRCSEIEIVSSGERAKPFERPVFSNVTTFNARIGPSGGARGVTAFKGQSWGIAWYLSPADSESEDVLIPAIGVERGKTYKFNVYGGDDPNDPSKYHPLYITSNPEGGINGQTPEDRLNERIYAGIDVTSRNESGIFEFTPTAAGALCMISGPDPGNNVTYDEFKKTLDASCRENETITDNAGVLEWTVAADTPDVVYYQCVTHRLLGFEIRVFDEGKVDVESLQELSRGESEKGGEGESECAVTVNGEELSFGGCTRDPETDYSVYWTIDGDEIDTLFRAPTGGGYVGFGWGYDEMVPAGNGNAVIAYQDGDGRPVISDYELSSKSSAGVQPGSNQQISNAQAFVDGNFVSGRFTRKLVVDGVPPLEAGRNVRAIWSMGSRPGSATTLQQHSRRGTFDINLSRGSSTADGGSGPAAIFVVHAVFMGLSWLLLAPTAITAIRYFKKHNPATFQIHRALNGTAVILVFVAFIMGVARGSRSQTAHLVIGCIVFSLMIIQGLGGALRPQKGAPSRKMWYFGHAIVGNVLYSLGVTNVFVGVSAIRKIGGSQSNAAYIVPGVAVGLYTVLNLVMCLFPSQFPLHEPEEPEDEEKVLMPEGQQAAPMGSRI